MKLNSKNEEENSNNDDSLKENAKGLKNIIYKMLNNLAKQDENRPKISDELMENLIPVLEQKGYNEEGKDVVVLLDSLVKNKNYFVHPKIIKIKINKIHNAK